MEAHRVKIATRIRRGRATLFVWECVCGASSPLHLSSWEANRSYLRHKNGLTAVEEEILPFAANLPPKEAV